MPKKAKHNKSPRFVIEDIEGEAPKQDEPLRIVLEIDGQAIAEKVAPAILNQPERLWLAELEARADGDDLLLRAHQRLLTELHESVMALMLIEIERETQRQTFWGRLKWMVRG